MHGIPVLLHSTAWSCTNMHHHVLMKILQTLTRELYALHCAGNIKRRIRNTGAINRRRHRHIGLHVMTTESTADVSIGLIYDKKTRPIYS